MHIMYNGTMLVLKGFENSIISFRNLCHAFEYTCNLDKQIYAAYILYCNKCKTLIHVYIHYGSPMVSGLTCLMMFNRRAVCFCL